MQKSDDDFLSRRIKRRNKPSQRNYTPPIYQNKLWVGRKYRKAYEKYIGKTETCISSLILRKQQQIEKQLRIKCPGMCYKVPSSRQKARINQQHGHLKIKSIRRDLQQAVGLLTRLYAFKFFQRVKMM